MKMTKKQFAKIERFMPIARYKPSIYQFMCALLHIIENGCKWRALPKKYGGWHTVYVKFNRWSKSGIISRIFNEMQKFNIIDIRTDAAGARKSNGEQSIGVLKGLTTKIHIVCTSAQFAMIFHLSAGNRYDVPEGRKLIESIFFNDKHYLLMDRAYEDDATRSLAVEQGFIPVIVSPKSKRKDP